MADLKIAQVGCGGMGLRHLYGEVELQQRADSFDVVAVCDLNRSAAEHVANEAEKGLGRRPKLSTQTSRRCSTRSGTWTRWTS